jgi:tetratricopeptide (TPR) repeat protein
MRSRVLLTVALALFLTGPLSVAHATLQQDYLNIYLKINDAEHLEKQGDFRGALDDFKDCYAKLSKIHQSDPNWETALVIHRMEDCKAKVLDLQARVDAMPPPAPPPPPTPPPALVVAPATNSEASNPPASGQPNAVPGGPSEEVTTLKQQLQAVKQELQITREQLKESQAQLETYRVQLQTVNEQLKALQSQQTVDERMGKLLSDNKALTDKLAAAQKELDDIKANPKSRLAMAQAQLKNLQDQYDASQEANKALQDTTTTLKEQLDRAQADLVSANQKLAAAGTGSPEYETLKRENEVMRDILTRELQEQAHRDMAKRLAQEEFDNLKLKSKVLQEQLDILGSPMTPPTNDQERELLASLKVPGPDVAPTTPNGFTATAPGNAATTNAAVAMAPTPAPPDTNAAAATPPATNMASGTPPAAATNAAGVTPPATDNSTNQPSVTIVMGTTPPGNGGVTTNVAPDASATNTPPVAPPVTPAGETPPAPPATTNMTDPTAPLPPTPSGAPPATQQPATNAAPPAPTPPTTPTTTKVPPGTTTVTDTKVTHGGDAGADQNDPTIYSTKARLPDDMRETAQDAADLFKNQKYDESAAKYQSIIDKYPESLYAWSNLGVVRFQQGKFDEALKALQQAVKLSPTDAFSYSNLGIVYYQLGQYENAIDALNSAKALDPNDAKTHNYLGCACSQKGWQEVAEKEFRKAIEIDPNFGDAHFNLALVYATSKPPSLELARREYNRALELGIAKDPRLEKLLGNPTPAATPSAP